MKSELVRSRMGKYLRLVRKLLILALIVIVASGCTTMRPVMPEPRASEETLKPGDNVRVFTRDGRVLDFKVKEVTEQRISGEKEEVPFSEIGHIERREFSPWKTTGLAVGGLVVAFAVLLVAGLSSGGAGFPAGSP